MDTHTFSRLVELTSYSVLLVAVAVVAQRNLATSIRLLRLEGFLLAMVSAVIGLYTGESHLFWVAAITFVIKGLAIPSFFFHVMHRIGLPHDAERSLTVPLGLMLASGLTLVAYHVGRPLALASPWITRDVLASSLGTAFIGLSLMIVCRKALTQMLGFLLMEDGIFLFGITETYGMPLLVELGIFFDLIVAAGVTGILLLRMGGDFGHVDVDRLSDLRG
ncbi:MAG: hypothetical protein HY816_20495 [Candidatus Wallbacteria bacterium]|nr:hypothetical protein [Candidatus Wallbacteria bacterium]